MQACYAEKPKSQAEYRWQSSNLGRAVGQMPGLSRPAVLVLSLPANAKGKASLTVSTFIWSTASQDVFKLVCRTFLAWPLATDFLPSCPLERCCSCSSFGACCAVDEALGPGPGRKGCSLALALRCNEGKRPCPLQLSRRLYIAASAARSEFCVCIGYAHLLATAELNVGIGKQFCQKA